MPSRPEDEWGKPYQQTDLPKEDHDSLVAELWANPGLLRNLLKQTSQEDDSLSASLLFGETEDDQEALDEKLRRYLLRDQTLTQEDIAIIEESLIEDERYFDRMLLVENELFEDYLHGALLAEEEQRFNNYFLITPEHREKLRRLRALAMATSVVQPEKIGQPAIALATSSWWQSLVAFVRPPNLLAGVVITTVILLLTFGALLWLTRQANQNEPLRVERPAEPMPQNTRLPPSDDQNNSNGSHEAINDPTPSSSPSTSSPLSPAPAGPAQNEQSPKSGAGRAPAPSKSAPPASRTTVFALVPGVLRGEGASTEKRIAPGSVFVKLVLRLNIERNYKDFHVVVEDSNGREVARSLRLLTGQSEASTIDNPQTVAASFFAWMFKPDDYTVFLIGEINGEYKIVDTYSFRILK